MFLLPRDYFEEVGGGFLREEGVAERGGGGWERGSKQVSYPHGPSTV